MYQTDMRPLDFEKAKMRYASLCARSEQCSADIRIKAKRAGLSSDDIERVITFLTENRFIDDRRFAGAFARDKAAFSGWGPYKIKVALIMKHIPENIISEALESVPEESFSNSVERILASGDNPGKMYRRLASRGFNPAKYL